MSSTIHNLKLILGGLDWPNLIGGALFGAILGLVVWFLTHVYESWIVSKDIPYRISGTWFSAEYELKGELPREDRNTITKVKVRRCLGGKFRIKVLTRYPDASLKPETSWKFIGKLVHGDTLLGTWKSTLKNTKRYGSAIIKFLDYGRAVGYWNGLAGKEYPAYGYLMMSRDEDDLRVISSAVLKETTFEVFDVVGFLLNMPPPGHVKLK